MPDVKVFISATQHDLEDNCLKAVQAVFDRFQEVVSVDMQTWTARHGRPLDVCMEQIEKWSTHYLGIFAFRRGWTPDGEMRSITELEYCKACDKYGEKAHEIQVFIPQEGSEIWRELEKLAGAQSPQEKEAQEMFRQRVMQKTCNPFPDVWKLRDRVEDVVRRWQDPNILDLADSGSTSPASDQEINLLGLDHQLKAFTTRLSELGVEDEKKSIAFVMYGPEGFGHRTATKELARQLDQSRRGELTYLVADLSDKQKDGEGNANIINGLSRSLKLKLDGLSKKEQGFLLATTLKSELLRHDVVLDIVRVDAHPQGLTGFLDFWEKLNQAVHSDGNTRYELITLIGHEGQADAAEERKPAVVFLPGLKRIELHTLAYWTRKWAKDTATAQRIARKALDGTDDIPDNVRARLRDPDTWQDLQTESTARDEDRDQDDEEYFSQPSQEGKR